MAAASATVSLATTFASSPAPTLAARQELRTITQTIRLPDTTFVSLVVLGGTPRVETSNPLSASSSDGLTSSQIAGIISGVVGFAVLVLLAWWYVHTSRRRQRQYEDENYEDLAFQAYLEEEQKRVDKARRNARRMHMQMQTEMPPEPPQPVYNVNRRPPWDPSYAGPKRNLPRRGVRY